MKLDTQTRRTISKTRQLLDVFRSVDPNMPLGECIAFLVLAEEPNRSTPEIQKAGNFEAGSTAGKYAQALSSSGKKTSSGGRTEGKELVHKEIDPTDERRRVYPLTTRGQIVLDALNKLWEK